MTTTRIPQALVAVAETHNPALAHMMTQAGVPRSLRTSFQTILAAAMSDAFAAGQPAADSAAEPVPHHADWCHGAPVFTQDSVGHWEAACEYGCQSEVTGCSTRREAGARFYGGDDRSIFE